MIDKEVLSYNHNIIDESYISKLRSNTLVSSTRNEEDVILAPCVDSESVCITRPKGVSDEYFYFYSGVIEDFKIRILFTDFESNLLKTLNICPSQLCINGWDFIKAFEIVCDTMDITPTLGLVFSFFKLKGVEKGGRVSLSRIPGRSFLQAYITNYKGFKDKFLRVKSGKRCPQVMYMLDGNYRFLIYWSDSPLSVFGFDYDKLSALEIRSLAVLDAFRIVKVKDLLQMAEDPEQIYDLLGNAYMFLFIDF